jgi:hypothetical protein
VFARARSSAERPQYADAEAADIENAKAAAAATDNTRNDFFI